MDNLLERLKNICLETRKIGQEVLSGMEGDMSNDLHYMCKLFSIRQLSQLDSLILLGDKDDVILVARSMFEGVVYLSYSIKHRDMCRRWRLFSVVIDKQRIEKSQEQVPAEVQELIERFLPEVDRLFKKKNGKYQRKWYGNKNIREISREIDNDFVYLYDKYYSPMSEYHHWATASFGKRYKLESNNIRESGTDEVKLERANAFFLALSSVFSTLKISCDLMGSGKIESIKTLEKKLRDLEGTSTRVINITRHST